MVPSQCTCRLEGHQSALERAAEIAEGLSEAPHPRFETSIAGGILTISVTGLAGHASTPDSAVNAAAYMRASPQQDYGGRLQL